ncbi:lytic transglycosylase domain-containing protein [Glaciihabitans arcticus]|uniref:Lytic transglycosylase domain-containing protein n=1 Tax=Glaciihabitans arcticus TaxID=2668039 RepID=A0A4V2JEM9_9MICO|nr:transglycosylase SLT domain-containing protein [Glaciihabitans arcticus]TBN56209.1 lytic transglycosylase domain-containing protein [Glaciihabitans arcticus]
MQLPAARGVFYGRRIRNNKTLPIFAFLACLTFVLTPAIDPTASFAIAEEEPDMLDRGPAQSVTASDEAAQTFARDDFEISKIEPLVRAAPAMGVPDPGSAQEIALKMVTARGWGRDQFDCLVALWNKESHWNVYAHNVGSGAYGIPQAMPGSKMASVGADWQTNPATQITWGLGYIQGRYATPCGAWAKSQSSGWY